MKNYSNFDFFPRLFKNVKSFLWAVQKQIVNQILNHWPQFANPCPTGIYEIQGRS